MRYVGKPRSKALGNLSHLPAETIDLVRRSLKDETFVPVGAASFDPDTDAPLPLRLM